MSKIKYLVTGIDNTVLGNLVGLLIGGELESGNDLVCCPGDPKAYKVADNGQVKEIPFDSLLSTLVLKERMRAGFNLSGEKLIRDIVEKSTNAGASADAS